MPLAAVLNQENTRWQPASVTYSGTDTLSFSDSTTENVALSQAFSDTSTFSDSASENVALTRAFADSLILTESAAKNVAFSRSVTDSAVLSETSARLIALSRALSDTGSFSESSTRNIVLSRTLADSVSFSEALARLLVLSRTVSDSESFSDSSTTPNVRVSALDGLSFSDNATQTVVGTDPVLVALPLTQLLDVVANSFYPDSYRLSAAIQAVKVISKSEALLKNYGPPWSITGSYNTILNEYSIRSSGFSGFIAQAQIIVGGI